MKTVRVSARSKAINALLEQARKQDVIVQAADGSEFMVTSIDDFDREIAATRRNKKLMAYLDGCARPSKLIPLDEVKRRLGLTKTASPNKKGKQGKGAKD